MSKMAGSIDFNRRLRAALHGELRELRTPMGFATRFGMDALGTGLLVANIPQDVKDSDPGLVVGMAAEDLADQAIPGLVAGTAVGALGRLTKNPMLRLAAPAVDMGVSLLGAWMGPRPFSDELSKRQAAKAAMERDRRERNMYLAGLNEGHGDLHEQYSPEHQIIDALIPGY